MAEARRAAAASAVAIVAVLKLKRKRRIRKHKIWAREWLHVEAPVVKNGSFGQHTGFFYKF